MNLIMMLPPKIGQVFRMILIEIHFAWTDHRGMDNPSFEFDYDMLANAAHKQGIIDTTTKIKRSRAFFLAKQRQVEVLNATAKDKISHSHVCRRRQSIDCISSPLRPSNEYFPTTRVYKPIMTSDFDRLFNETSFVMWILRRC